MMQINDSSNLESQYDIAFTIETSTRQSRSLARPLALPTVR